MSETLLTTLQSDLAGRLSADSYFSDVPVVTELKKNITATIERALGVVTTKAGKVGACLVLMSPIATVESPNVPGALLIPQITVRVLENPTINTGTSGTGKAALSLARRVAMVLHHYTPQLLASPIIADAPTIVPVEDPYAPLAYEVRFRCTESDPGSLAKVATPTISVAGSSLPYTVTLTCSTSGASVYYTKDGSHPYVGNTTATLYSTSVTVSLACTFRAGAFKTGYIGSDVAATQLS